MPRVDLAIGLPVFRALRGDGGWFSPIRVLLESEVNDCSRAVVDHGAPHRQRTHTISEMPHLLAEVGFVDIGQSSQETRA